MTRVRLRLAQLEELDCPAGWTGGPPGVALEVADLNRDGTPDVVAADPAADDVRVWLRTPGTGTFAESFRATAGVQEPTAVRVADLNADGYPDLIVANGGGEVRVYAGRPGNAFDPVGEYPVGANPRGLLVADVNDDTIPDVLTANEGSNDVSVLFGQVIAGRWAPALAVRLPSAGVGPTDLFFRDQTGDGRPDLIVFNRGSHALAVLRGLGDGQFHDPPSAAALLLPAAGTTGPVFGPVTSTGFITDGSGNVFGFDLNNPAIGVRPILSAGPGETVIGLAPVTLQAGAGLVLVTASGRVALAGRTADGSYSVRQASLAAGGPFTAAAATRGATGFDVYLAGRGSGRPTVVTLQDVPSVGVGPTDGPSTVQLAAVHLSFDVGTATNALAPVPAVSPRPGGQAQTAADVRAAPGEPPLEFVAAWGAALDPTDPSSNEAEAVRRWEEWYLDLDRLLREALRPNAAPASQPSGKPAGPTESRGTPTPPSRDALVIVPAEHAPNIEQGDRPATDAAVIAFAPEEPGEILSRYAVPTAALGFLWGVRLRPSSKGRPFELGRNSEENFLWAAPSAR
ncbi:FG-GAP repeat domain-containing protein [Limnoglobus roseus]|uniref:VCBS repeat-containing protein n=1 Tax=Limnoglobus roseus TaxID=2598579 RepID=A0A5C1AJ18_9BACT|nr:VCBS repeat-containing protein [Limnoglobus roseus]QEL17692.1 VCBS repeat-containing protein [Limnoglobus roseus]